LFHRGMAVHLAHPGAPLSALQIPRRPPEPRPRRCFPSQRFVECIVLGRFRATKKIGLTTWFLFRYSLVSFGFERNFSSISPNYPAIRLKKHHLRGRSALSMRTI